MNNSARNILVYYPWDTCLRVSLGCSVGMRVKHMLMCIHPLGNAKLSANSIYFLSVSLVTTEISAGSYSWCFVSLCALWILTVSCSLPVFYLWAFFESWAPWESVCLSLGGITQNRFELNSLLGVSNHIVSGTSDHNLAQEPTCGLQIPKAVSSPYPSV